jgi:hypothetical protein
MVAPVQANIHGTPSDGAPASGKSVTFAWTVNWPLSGTVRAVPPAPGASPGFWPVQLGVEPAVQTPEWKIVISLSAATWFASDGSSP